MRSSKILRSLVCFLAFSPAAFGSFIVQPSAAGGIDVNGVPVASPDINDTTPVAPAGGINLLWSVSGSDISGAYSLNPSFGTEGSPIGAWINTTQTATAAWSRPFNSKNTFLKGSPIPDTGWARALTVTMSAAMPQGRTLTATLFKNDQATALTVSIPPGAAAGAHASIDANFIRFLESDAMVVQFDNVSVGGSGQIATWSLDWASDNSNATIVGMGLPDSTQAASNTTFGQPCGATRSAAEITVQIPWAVAGTFAFMYVLTDSTQNAGGTFDHILRVNGANSALRVDVPAGGLLGAYNDTVNSVVVAQADLINFANVNNAAAVSAQLASVLMRFTVGTGSSVLCGAMGGTLAAAGTGHLAPFGNIDVATPTDTDFAVTRGGTIQNLHTNTTAAMPADGGLTLTVQKNGVDQSLLINIPALAGAGIFADTVNSFTVVQGDLVRVEIVNSSPSTPRGVSGWSMEFAQ